MFASFLAVADVLAHRQLVSTRRIHEDCPRLLNLEVVICLDLHWRNFLVFFDHSLHLRYRLRILKHHTLIELAVLPGKVLEETQANHFVDVRLSPLECFCIKADLSELVTDELLDFWVVEAFRFGLEEVFLSSL